MTNKPMLSVELLPCPFCGSSASLEDHRLVWCMRCTKCSACVLGDRAPEPHGDGVSSDEVQDAQAAAMSENTDWASYEKSAVDAWNSRSTTAAQHQGDPVRWERMSKMMGGAWWPCANKAEADEAVTYGWTVRPLFAEQPAPVAPFIDDTVVCRRYTLEQSPGQNFYHYDLEPVYGSVPVTLSELISMAEAAPVAVVMPERKGANHKDWRDWTQEEIGYNKALDDVARLNGVKP